MVNYPISVSLPVFQELTRRLSEGRTHDDVLRDILKIDSFTESEQPDPSARFETIGAEFAKAWAKADGGFRSRGLWLPNGTKLRARYLQRIYTAEIKDGEWVSANGEHLNSPSAAANAITGNSVNGLRFWEAQRPGEVGWRRLEHLVS